MGIMSEQYKNEPVLLYFCAEYIDMIKVQFSYKKEEDV